VTRAKTKTSVRTNKAQPQGPLFVCLSGPNLQLLGTREPAIYGRATLDDIHRMLEERALALGVRVRCAQSNHEGTLCDWIAEAREQAQGILINAGGYSHTSIAIADALRAAALPAVEVHVSNPEAREAFRHHSILASACIGKVTGFGARSYRWALEALVAHVADSVGT